MLKSNCDVLSAFGAYLLVGDVFLLFLWDFSGFVLHNIAGGHCQGAWQSVGVSVKLSIKKNSQRSLPAPKNNGLLFSLAMANPAHK